ncbi:MAG: IS1634-like element ISMac12 family transposase [Rectinema sp.]
MNDLDSKNNTFRYVFRKDLGYYTVSTDDPYWDKEKKQMRHRYTLVGKSATKNGPIEFGPKYRAQEAHTSFLAGLRISTTTLAGELLVLQQIEQELGMQKLLTKAFDKATAQRILALAFYTICTGQPLSYAGVWLEQRGLGSLELEAPRISDLLPTLTVDKQRRFFSSWLTTKAKGGTLCYDITSVSSYGRDNELLEYGYNRDGEHMKQINIALLSGKHSGLPVWYSLLPGSLNDVKTLQNLVRELKKLGLDEFSLIMDRGFYSAANLQFLAEHHITFMIPIPDRTGWHKDLIVQHRERLFANVQGYIPSEDGKTTLRSLTIYHPLDDGTRAWLHIYYDSTIRSHAEQQFMALYKTCFDEFSSGNLDPAHQAFYDEYFTRGYKTKHGQKVIPKKDPVTLFNEGIAGYWCIYTTSEKDAKNALEAYRERSAIEQLFDDLKNTLDCSRLRVHTTAATQGRLFIQFIALILLSELKRKLKEHREEVLRYGNYKSILSRVMSYSRIKFEGSYKDVYTTPTKGQETIFNALGVEYSQQHA